MAHAQIRAASVWDTGLELSFAPGADPCVELHGNFNVNVSGARDMVRYNASPLWKLTAFANGLIILAFNGGEVRWYATPAVIETLLNGPQ